jgi:hypothetical protein
MTDMTNRATKEQDAWVSAVHNKQETDALIDRTRMYMKRTGTSAAEICRSISIAHSTFDYFLAGKTKSKSKVFEPLRTYMSINENKHPFVCIQSIKPRACQQTPKLTSATASYTDSISVSTSTSARISQAENGSGRMAQGNAVSPPPSNVCVAQCRKLTSIVIPVIFGNDVYL